jgi:hypothetical protein
VAIGIDELAIDGVVCTFGKTYCPNGDDVVILEEMSICERCVDGVLRYSSGVVHCICI